MEMHYIQKCILCKISIYKICVIVDVETLMVVPRAQESFLVGGIEMKSMKSK